MLTLIYAPDSRSVLWTTVQCAVYLFYKTVSFFETNSELIGLLKPWSTCGLAVTEQHVRLVSVSRHSHHLALHKPFNHLTITESWKTGCHASTFWLWIHCHCEIDAKLGECMNSIAVSQQKDWRDFVRIWPVKCRLYYTSHLLILTVFC